MGTEQIGELLLDRPVRCVACDSGEAVVAAFLRDNGFSITRTEHPVADVACIEAEYGGYRVLIEVKAAAFPLAPPEFTANEERELLDRAREAQRLALEARVQLRGGLETPAISLRYLH